MGAIAVVTGSRESWNDWPQITVYYGFTPMSLGDAHGRCPLPLALFDWGRPSAGTQRLAWHILAVVCGDEVADACYAPFAADVLEALHEQCFALGAEIVQVWLAGFAVGYHCLASLERPADVLARRGDE